MTGGRAGWGCDWVRGGGMGSRRGCVEVGRGESGVGGEDRLIVRGGDWWTGVVGEFGLWSCAGWKCTGLERWVTGDEGCKLIVTGGDPLRR